jgi:hypothetical protein
MANQPRNKGKWVPALLALLLTSHLAFLGFKDNSDSAAQDFQQAAETYVTVLLALLAPSPMQ